MASVSPRRTRNKNATQHPGQVVLDTQVKRRTKAQVAADNQRSQDAQEAEKAAVKLGVSRIASMEVSMEAMQEVQATKKAKAVKPRPVMKKPRNTAGVAEAGNLVSSKVKGDHTLGKDADDADVESEVKDIASAPKPKKIKKTLAMRAAINAAKDQMTDSQAQATLDKKENPVDSESVPHFFCSLLC
jgi:hypothetical protein